MAVEMKRTAQASQTQARPPTLSLPPGRSAPTSQVSTSGTHSVSASDPADAWSAARWRRESGKVAAFILVLGLLEGANWYLLSAAFSWVLPGTVLPGLAALALIVVLIGTVLSGSLLANPALSSHRARLRVTLGGLLALQFGVNALEGFVIARGHLPTAAAEFFLLDPAAMARIVGTVLGGSLALITFSYLLLVARILEEMLPPPNLQREAEVLLRRYERLSTRARAGSGRTPVPPPDPLDPTVPMSLSDLGNGETQPATRFWDFLRRQP